ncbi:uncharacterized protein LOC129959934 isoform X1 [Argiope bruennichi]|uniref:uncharacterized protein LOC129959934 isoform X1 n=1 Tax=Argiope bruennichi TaxID=94029 RepID=UPI002494F0D8|nr:uncharacterized protein LOC129959934 isoform X1 [Argiope bruennichi]
MTDAYPGLIFLLDREIKQEPPDYDENMIYEISFQDDAKANEHDAEKIVIKEEENSLDGAEANEHDPGKIVIKEEENSYDGTEANEHDPGKIVIKEEENSQDGAKANEYEVKKPKEEPKFDSHGVHIETQLDLCDCMNNTCEGCFLPCEYCFSNKCGHECRNDRAWIYESMDIEGTQYTLKSHFAKRN